MPPMYEKHNSITKVNISVIVPCISKIITSLNRLRVARQDRVEVRKKYLNIIRRKFQNWSFTLVSSCSIETKYYKMDILRNYKLFR